MGTVERKLGPTSALLTAYMALFLVLNAFALNALLYRVTPEPFKESGLWHTWEVLHGRGSDDSWGVMKLALDYLEKPGEKPLYEEIFFSRKFKFQYPPSSLFTLAGLIGVAGAENVRTNETQVFSTPPLNDILGWGFLLAVAASSSVLMERGLRSGGLTGDRGLLVAARAAIVLALTLTFYPLVKAYSLGQIQVWINGMFALALLCWALGQRAMSGVMVGLMCLIKPHYGLFLLWGVLRREWRFAGALLIVFGIGTAAAIAAYGLANHVDYLRLLGVMTRNGEIFYPNQSFNGIFNRLLSISDPIGHNSLEFDAGELAAFNVWVSAGTVLTSMLILGTALLRGASSEDPDRTLDFATMALSVTMAAPIAWEHHYGVTMPILAVLFVRSIGDRRRLILIAASYVLISNFIPATNLLAGTLFNVVQSYLFAGALILLWLLHSTRDGWMLAVPRLARLRPAATGRRSGA